GLRPDDDVGGLGRVLLQLVRQVLVPPAHGTTTSATKTAGPRRRIVSATWTSATPPGISTRTWSPTSPQSRAASAATEAPDPHASVTPAPRSQWSNRIAS